MIGIVIVTMVLLGCVSWLTSLESGYGGSMNLTSINYTESELNSKMEKMTNTSNETLTTIRGLTFGSESVATTLFYAPYNMMKLGWQVLSLVFNSWDIFFTLISENLTNLSLLGIQVPVWLIGGIITIIIFAIVFIITEMYFRWKLES